jgi:hypothetical protein
MNWQTTTDRYGFRVQYAVTPVGMYVIDGNSTGPLRWTVDYPDTDEFHPGDAAETRAEAREWAEQDFTRRSP